FQTKSLGRRTEIDASRLLQRRDEGRRGAARFQQVVRHAAVLIPAGTRRAGPSALTLSATTPLRLEATSRSRSSLASSPWIRSRRAWVDGRGGPSRSQISGPLETSYVPISFARSTISCLSNPINGLRTGRRAIAS